MSQSSSVESPTQAFSNPSLNPALQVALASMDVQLDAELARYRRESKKHPPLKAPASPAQIPEGRVQIAPPEPPIAGNDNGNGKLLSDAPASQNATDALSPAPIDAPTSTNTASADSNAVQNPPQDYLKSSAALLDSPDSATTPDVPEPKTGGMLSPLGIGSMLLFLLATATLGYVAFNPSSLNYLGLARLMGKPGTQQPGTAVPAGPETPPSATAGKIPGSPDLSSQEFPNLELDTLSGINPNPNPAPTTAVPPKPAPAAPTAAPQPAGTASSLSNLSTVLSPGSTPAKPANSGGQPPKPVVDDRYYNLFFVVAKYDSKPETLSKAQQVAPEAYLRKFPVGDRIQLGAFDNSNSAQQLVDRLREKGITAEVYKPE